MVSTLKRLSVLFAWSALAASAQVLPVANGGTGTSSPGLIPGTGIQIAGAWPDQTVGLVGGTLTVPYLLKFGPPNVLPYFDPQPSGLIDVTDNFASTGTFTQQTGGGTVGFSVASNVGTLAFSGTAPIFANFLETSDTTLVAPQFFDSIEVTAITTASGFSNIYAGAFKDNSNYVAVFYDATNHAMHSEYRFAGTNEAATLQSSLTLTPPYWIGASLVGNSLSAWYKKCATCTWQYSGNTQTNGFFDYTTTANFASAGFKTGFSVSWDGTGSVSVANLQGGRFGGAIMRDLKPVVNPDWTAYQPGGNLIYFTASVGDPAGSQIGPSGGTTQGIFTLNVNSQTITETGTICQSRSSHIYCGDAAGNVIYHTNGDREVILSSWGNVVPPSTHAAVFYKYLTNGVQPDVLTNNLTVLSSATQLTLPMASGATDAYDPALAFDSVNNRYLMAYTQGTISPLLFYPALATASSPTGTWTSIGIDNNLQGNWEGTSFSNVQGVLYELTGGPRFWPQSANLPTCSSSRIYDETFTYQGSLVGATFINGSTSPSGVNCSHPTLVQHPDGYHMILLTFDGSEFVGGNTGSTGRPMMEISTQ